MLLKGLYCIVITALNSTIPVVSNFLLLYAELNILINTHKINFLYIKKFDLKYLGLKKQVALWAAPLHIHLQCFSEKLPRAFLASRHLRSLG